MHRMAAHQCHIFRFEDAVFGERVARLEISFTLFDNHAAELTHHPEQEVAPY